MNSSTRETILAMELSNRGLPQKITECIFSAILIITAFTGNFLVCLAIKNNTKLRTVPNYYIASLALADMLMSLFGMPLTFATLIADDWILGEALCQYQGYVGTVLGIASLLIITLTAVNRYFRIVRVRQYSKYYTTKNAILSIVLAWSLALISPIPYFAIGNRFRFHPGKVMCFFDLDNNDIVYSVSTIICFVMLPFAVIAACYYKVFRTVRKHNSTLASTRTLGRAGKFGVAEVQLAKLLFVILLSFVACWTPFLIIDVIGAFKGQFYFPRYVYLVYTVSVEFSSCINPVIYGAMNKEFRSEFKKLFTAGCCRISLHKETLRATYVVDSMGQRNEVI
ncbi:melatonin receptor type 1B-B-like [Oculina patagonica]